MFKAIGRFLKTIGYMITGVLSSSTKGINENPNVIRARFDDLIDKKRKSILQVRNAVAGLIRNIERKHSEVKFATEEINKKECLMSGAKAKATKISEGKSREESQKDVDFISCMKAYKDFKSSLQLIMQRKEILQQDVDQTENEAKIYETQLKSLHRELQEFIDERERSVADVVMAKETRIVNEVIAGIANDGASEDLRQLKEIVSQAKAEAQVTSRLAGNDTARQEAEFMEMAEGTETESEFMDAIFGKEELAA